MSILNVNGWTVNQVNEWISGLDPTICIYATDLAMRGVDGSKLLNLMAGDLETLGIKKVGDQLLLHDAIQSLRNEMESDRVTLQTLASNLSVRCKSYRSELSALLPKTNRIPTQSLSSAAYLLDSSKTLVRWLTRYPFLGVKEYETITKSLTNHCFELALMSQRDSFADNVIEEIQYLCTKIIESCDLLITSKDLLVYQPAAVDVITIRKRHEQELGLQFETSYFGLHLVSGVIPSTPAHSSGQLERGDEILQVNYQTVVGWSQANLISLLHENPYEVSLTLKRRPRHGSNLLGQLYLKPHRVPTRKLPSPVTEEVGERDLVHSSESEVVSPVKSPDEKVEESSEPSSISSDAETRFWNLYPRPTLLRRRASVSGASPTSTRPPVTFVQDESSLTPGGKKRPPLDKSKSESNKLDVDEELLKLFVGESNIKGSRITLPLMDNLTTLTSSAPHPPPIIPSITTTQFEPIAENLPPSIVQSELEAQLSNQSEKEEGESRSQSENRVLNNDQSGNSSVRLSSQLETAPSSSQSEGRDDGSSSQPEAYVQNKSQLEERECSINQSGERHVRLSSQSERRFSESGSSSSQSEGRVIGIMTQLGERTLKSQSGGGKMNSQSGERVSNCDESGENVRKEIYCGCLHERAQWKFGPRWNRHKCSLYSHLLLIGTHPYKLGPGEFSVSLATEVHSRPFAFKLEKIGESQGEKEVVYIAAESGREMEIWVKLISKETGQSYPLAPSSSADSVAASRIYRRSFSLQSNRPEKPPRRCSLPHKNETRVSPRYRVPRTEVSKLKSSSTSRLDEKKCLISTATPPPYAPKSNISSITIMSFKKEEQKNINNNKELHNYYYSPSSQTNLDVSNGNERGMNLKKSSKERRIANDNNVDKCGSCGSRVRVSYCDTASQTDNNLLILIQGHSEDEQIIL